MNKTKCVAIIGGIAKSGTTLLARIINSHSQIFSGVECGILMKTPETFHTVKPYAEWLLQGGEFFGLPDSYLDDIKNLSYEEIYNYISLNKGSKGGHKFNEGSKGDHLQKMMRSTPYFVDKGPRYYMHLKGICEKLKGLNIPIFIICKKFNSLYHSYCVKRNIGVEKVVTKTNVFVQNVQGTFENVYFIRHEEFTADPEEYIQKISRILYEYNPDLAEEQLSLERFAEKINGHHYGSSGDPLVVVEKCLPTHSLPPKMLAQRDKYDSFLEGLDYL